MVVRSLFVHAMRTLDEEYTSTGARVCRGAIILAAAVVVISPLQEPPPTTISLNVFTLPRACSSSRSPTVWAHTHTRGVCALYTATAKITPRRRRGYVRDVLLLSSHHCTRQAVKAAVHERKPHIKKILKKKSSYALGTRNNIVQYTCEQ